MGEILKAIVPVPLSTFDDHTEDEVQEMIKPLRDAAVKRVCGSKWRVVGEVKGSRVSPDSKIIGSHGNTVYDLAEQDMTAYRYEVEVEPT